MLAPFNPNQEYTNEDNPDMQSGRGNGSWFCDNVKFLYKVTSCINAYNLFVGMQTYE
jgi:hypothetical protein